VVPGGGLTKNGKWLSAKTKGKYLFSVKAMSKVFKAIYSIPSAKKSLA